MSVRKLLVRVFNLIFLAGAAFSCFKLATEPILKVDVSLGSPTNILEGILFPDSTDTSNLDEESSVFGGVTRKNVKEAFEGAELGLNLELPVSLAYDFQNADGLANAVTGDLDKFTDSTVKTFADGFESIIKSFIDKTTKDTLVSTIDTAVYDNVAAFSEDTKGGESAEEKKAYAKETAAARVPNIGTTIAEYAISTLKLSEDECPSTTKISKIKENVKDNICAVLKALANPTAADGKGALQGYQHFYLENLKTEIENAMDSQEEIEKVYISDPLADTSSAPSTKDWADAGYCAVVNSSDADHPFIYSFEWKTDHYELTLTNKTVDDLKAEVEKCGYLMGAKQGMNGIVDGIESGLSTFEVDGTYQYYAAAIPVVIGMAGIDRIEVDSTSTMTIKSYYEGEPWAFDGLKVYGYIGDGEDAIKFDLPKYLYSVTPSFATPAELTGSSMTLTVALNDGDADTTIKVEGFEVSGLSYTASARSGDFPTTEKFDGNKLIRKSIEILVSGMVLPMLGSVTGMIPVDALNIAGYAGYAMLGLVALAALPWLLFALVTLIRTLRPKKCWTKVWIVFVFAFLELVLGAVLTIGLKYAFPMLKPMLINLITQGDATSPFASILGGLNLNIQFGCYWASLVYVGMIPLTIIYMIIAHGVKKEFKEFKKQKKEEKRAAKLAKKAA